MEKSGFDGSRSLVLAWYPMIMVRYLIHQELHPYLPPDIAFFVVAFSELFFIPLFLDVVSQSVNLGSIFFCRVISSTLKMCSQLFRKVLRTNGVFIVMRKNW